MYIAYILPEFVTESSAGGLATYYDNISRFLADVGNRVIIFVLSDKNESFEYYPGITVTRVFVDISYVDSSIPGSYIRCWSKEINRVVREYIESGGRIDIIQYANYLALGFERLERVPTIIRISSFQPYMRAAARLFFDPDQDYKCETAADFLEMLSVIKADAVYSPSRMLSEIFNKEAKKIVRIIESPFYPKSGLSSKSFEDKLIDKRYIITFSTLNLLKGTKLIGDCIKEVLEMNPDLFWVFAGVEVSWEEENGDVVTPYQYISGKAGKYARRAIFLGKVEHERVLELVANAEACVMPSRIDNLPNTCIEAMALGKIVIGTRGASFDQLITDGQNGFIINRENREELIQIINKVIKLDRSQKNSIGELAKKKN